MRFVVLSALLSVSVSAYAVLPTVTGTNNEVRYVAAPITNKAMPTTNKVVANPSLLQNTLTKQATNALAPVVNVFVVKTDASGAETLVPVNAGVAVKSGDVLEYQGLFTNQSHDRVRKAEVTLSIGQGLELVGGVSPQFAHATIDGSRFVRMPIRANVNGQIQELPLSRYKALRWTIEEVGIGATAVVKYRAKLK
ncbi:MAG: hypothetical protein Q4A69_02185 [Moraxella sp.]|nr:hypothetical protein [Moraxella sp.]